VIAGYNTDMEDTSIKNQARRIIDALDDDATWDDLMREIYVRQSIEAGMRDSEADEVVDVAEVRRRFGLTG